MSSFEIPAPQPNGNPNYDVHLPDIVDDEWCAAFNSAYGWQGMRSIVNTYALMRKGRYGHICTPRTGPASYSEADIGEVPEDGLYLDGEVKNARLVPIYDDWVDEFDYIPHLVMTDLVDVQNNRPMSLPDEEIWVPLTENGDTILLYS